MFFLSSSGRDWAKCLIASNNELNLKTPVMWAAKHQQPMKLWLSGDSRGWVSPESSHFSPLKCHSNSPHTYIQGHLACKCHGMWKHCCPTAVLMNKVPKQLVYKINRYCLQYIFTMASVSLFPFPPLWLSVLSFHLLLLVFIRLSWMIASGGTYRELIMVKLDYMLNIYCILEWCSFRGWKTSTFPHHIQLCFTLSLVKYKLNLCVWLLWYIFIRKSHC